MAVLFCENELADRLAGLRKQSEEPVNESPNGVRITCGILRLTHCVCDACGAPMFPGEKAMLIEFFVGAKPPRERYPGNYFQKGTMSEEVICYGVPNCAPALSIDEFQIPAFVVGDSLQITAVTRKGALLLCESSHLVVERLVVEFQNWRAAEAFVANMENGTAVIVIDPELRPGERTPDIKRIAVMHDIGVSTYGFRGQEDKLREWMDAYGFGSGGMLMVE
jgi:hypothetical protein